MRRTALGLAVTLIGPATAGPPTRDYQLTSSDAGAPTHYGFVVPSRLDAIEADSAALLTGRSKADEPSAAKVRAIIDALDSRGAWVEPGRSRFHAEAGAAGVIRCQTFADNAHALAAYISANPGKP